MAAFVDSTTLLVRSGRGGDGCISFCREKYRPYGGPDGGNGGDGGSVRLKVRTNIHTLGHLRYRKHLSAQPGERGGKARRHGRRGEDVVIAVPPGTVVQRHSDGHHLCDLTLEYPEHLLLAGGRGGRGNATYKNARNQQPQYAQEGEEGHEEWLRLELRLIADVALVGFPNVGKSSLLAALSAAHPRIASYPFTSLTPTLGVYHGENYFSLTIADIPGIIIGASRGVGLGLRFLQHLYRVKLLAIILSLRAIEGYTAHQQYQAIQREVAHYDSRLLEKPSLLVTTMLDLPEAPQQYAQLASMLPAAEPLGCSAKSGEGLHQLGRALELAVKTSSTEIVS